VATLLAVAGCSLLALGGGGLRMDLAGLLLALGAGGSYALYVIASKELVAVQRPDAATGVVFGLGAVLLAPVFIFQDFGWLTHLSGWLVALHLGVMTCAVAYALFTQGLLTTPVATAVTLTLGEPVTAALLGVAVLRETLTLSGALGVGLVLAGLALLAWWPRPLPERVPVEER
jgi:DME family drug/metabolite transporter